MTKESSAEYTHPVAEENPKFVRNPTPKSATERFLEKKYGLYDRLNVSKRGLDIFIIVMILATLLLIFYGIYITK